MKRRYFPIVLIAISVVEMIALIVFAVQTPDFTQDVVAVNEIMQSVVRDFDALDMHKNSTSLDYVVTDNDGNVLYRTKSGLSEDINAAVLHRDTILDIKRNGVIVGKLIIFNDGAMSLLTQKKRLITVLAVALAVQCAVCVAYSVYLHLTVIRPFDKLRGFAGRVACGNFDIPLEMDRHNLFGAFTESFDIMRSELKKARIAEAQANASKKELVAKLSHDIKTPVASIKAVSEVGLAVAKSAKDRENYERIIEKADQINALVTNLFTATLEELQQLTVAPENIESTRIRTMLENADYLHKATIPELPDCLLLADSLRLQQVFDNIFANSYKYADTEISVAIIKDGDSLHIAIEDSGGGVLDEELSVLKDKFKRGRNSVNTDGAGLGLYISDYFMNEMHGALDVENGVNGLKVTVTLPLSGSI